MSEPRLKFEPGDWYQNPKARARRLSLNSLSKEARQVYARVELATMGYGQEKAVVARADDKHRLLTIGDIARDTELSEANVRRAFRNELEPQGMAERRAIDGGSLHKGNVAIYSTAFPPSKPREKKRGRARPQFPSGLPESWAPLTAFARREKIPLPEEVAGARDLNPGLIERGNQVARDLENAMIAARAFCNEVRARSESADTIRKKETDRQEEIDRQGTTPEDLKEEERPATTFETPVPESAPSPLPQIVSEPEPPATVPTVETIAEQTPDRAIHIVSPPSLAEHVRAWLQGKFPVPTALGPDVFREIMASIPDEAVFAQFQEAVQGAQPYNWKYFIRIARSCFINRETYAAVKAAHNGTRETKHSKATQEALDIMRRRIQRGQAPL